MGLESYSLFYFTQTEKSVGFTLESFESGKKGKLYWFPKSQIEVDGVSHDEDFDELERFERLDVYIPDWLAEKEGIL